MPHGPAHKRQRGKNYFVLAILVGMVAMFYFLTVVKIRGA